MTLAPMPYFDRSTHSIQEGFRCGGCYQAPHICDHACYTPIVPIDPQYSKQKQSIYISPVEPVHVCVCLAKKRQKIEYLRRDFELHYQHCEHAKRFCMKLTRDNVNLWTPIYIGP